jgi:hypothetical protein
MSIFSMGGQIQELSLSSRDKWWLWECGVGLVMALKCGGNCVGGL